MKKSWLILASVLVLSSIIYSQEKSSFQFSGGRVYPLSSSPGLSGGIQYNYNINTRFNLFISADRKMAGGAVLTANYKVITKLSKTYYYRM